MFTSHEAREFTYPTGEDDAVITQTVIGWSLGGCDIVWSDVLPRLLAAHGKAMVGNKTVIELGAGCGLVGLIAAHWASRVDITDGDEEEVELIQRNCEEHAPSTCACAGHHLDWGTDSASELRAALLPNGFDVVLASQVVYVPAAIAKLVETIAALLAPGGCAYLYNDAVTTLSTQQECRALLDAALAAKGLVAVPCALRLPPGAVMPHENAYLLTITRVDEQAAG